MLGKLNSSSTRHVKSNAMVSIKNSKYPVHRVQSLLHSEWKTRRATDMSWQNNCREHTSADVRWTWALRRLLENMIHSFVGSAEKDKRTNWAIHRSNDEFRFMLAHGNGNPQRRPLANIKHALEIVYHARRIHHRRSPSPSIYVSFRFQFLMQSNEFALVSRYFERARASAQLDSISRLLEKWRWKIVLPFTCLARVRWHFTEKYTSSRQLSHDTGTCWSVRFRHLPALLVPSMSNIVWLPALIAE